MTAATRPTALHILHQISSAVGACKKKPAVADVALVIPAKMKGMAEKCISIETDILDCVALRAAPRDTECCLAVMAAAAGKASFHLLHGHMRIGFVSSEKFCMAVSAAEKRRMEFMAEDYSAEVRNLYRNLFCQVAYSALGKTERTVFVVTLTTRLPLLHFRHGYGRVFNANLEEDIMAKSTVIPQFFEMRIMWKRDRADALRRDGCAFIILGVEQQREAEEQ